MRKLSKLIIAILLCTVLTSNSLPFFPSNSLTDGTPAYAAVNNSLPLIFDENSVDYMSYIPELSCSKKVKKELNIQNPDLSVAAASAILITEEGKVLFRKNATAPVFPGSTTKLLTSLVVLDWCKTSEKIKIGESIKMIAGDSSTAGLKQGEVLDINTLLAAMLLPSGNDAAYVAAAYVGKKSLKNHKAKTMDAVKEFSRLMNEKAKELGAENSCFITPDGYDAKGQYTTAYDMSRIALAATNNSTILKITKKCSLNATASSGERHFWKNSNALLNKESEWYNSNAIGLKTGTTSMAGRCLISAAKNEQGTVISVVMNSTMMGRWEDSNKLLNYGLKKLQ